VNLPELVFGIAGAIAVAFAIHAWFSYRKLKAEAAALAAAFDHEMTRRMYEIVGVADAPAFRAFMARVEARPCWVCRHMGTEHDPARGATVPRPCRISGCPCGDFAPTRPDA
jgi:hypothetical protein